MEPNASTTVLEEPRRLGRRGVTFIALVALVAGLGLGIITTLFYRLLPDDEDRQSDFFRDFSTMGILQTAMKKGSITKVTWNVSDQGGGSPWFGSRRTLNTKHYLAEAEMEVTDQNNFMNHVQQAVYELMGRKGVANFGSGGGSTSTSGVNSSSRRENRHFQYQSSGRTGQLQVWMFAENKKVTFIFSLAEN